MADISLDECPNSLHPCGHHCHHSWTSDCCCWCDWTGEDEWADVMIAKEEKELGLPV